jgi:hypothetical protein
MTDSRIFERVEVFQEEGTRPITWRVEAYEDAPRGFK